MFVVDGIDLTEKAKKSINCINSYSIPREGIAICSGVNPLVSYQEVTGYYIPTLLKYQLKNIALSYANYWLNVTIHALGTTFRSQNFKPTPKSP